MISATSSATDSKLRFIYWQLLLKNLPKNKNVRITGGLTNPRPWRRRCRAGFSNTGGPPLPRKRVPLQKKECQKNVATTLIIPWPLVLLTEIKNYLEALQFKAANMWCKHLKFLFLACKILFECTIMHYFIFIDWSSPIALVHVSISCRTIVDAGLVWHCPSIYEGTGHP